MRYNKSYFLIFFLILVSGFYLLDSYNVNEYTKTQVMELNFDRIHHYNTKYFRSFTYCIYLDSNLIEYKYRINYGDESCLRYNLNNITYSYKKNILGFEKREILKFNQIQ